MALCYYPTKLAKNVTPEEYKADNKLSDGRVIEKMVVYKEHDEQRQDVGKYKLYTQVGEQKMSRTMSKEDLNAYFDRVTTPSKLVEKNFGEQLHFASFYNQFKLEEGVKDVRIAKNYDGDWTVLASSLTTGRQSRMCSHGTTSRCSLRQRRLRRRSWQHVVSTLKSRRCSRRWSVQSGRSAGKVTLMS